MTDKNTPFDRNSILPIGEYHVRITQYSKGTSERKGTPFFKLRFENQRGYIDQRFYMTQGGFKFISRLFEAAGVQITDFNKIEEESINLLKKELIVLIVDVYSSFNSTSFKEITLFKKLPKAKDDTKIKSNETKEALDIISESEYEKRDKEAYDYIIENSKTTEEDPRKMLLKKDVLPELPFSIKFTSVPFEERIRYTIDEQRLYSAVEVKEDFPKKGELSIRVQGINKYFNSRQLTIYSVVNPN